MSATILVTDGEQRSALAVVRSLGRAGHRVHVCSSSGRSLAGVSRYAVSEHAIADPLMAPGNFSADVTRLVHRLGVHVLIPVGEAALLSLLPRRDQLAEVRLPFPTAEQFRRISDKAIVTGVAAELGLRVPAQRVVRTAADGAALDLGAISLPVVLKPARSVVDTGRGRVKVGVRYAATRDELAAALGALAPAAYPVLLQQRIVGPGVGIFLLLWEGRTVAVFAHRRIREKPVSGGVSVYRESIPADSGLVERSRRLLDCFGWQGVAMVEYKLDAVDGAPYLMEVNGRLWGSLQLAIDAGVDFPTLLVCLALGEDVEPVLDYRSGVRSRWWLGDVDHLLQRLRYSDTALALPPGSPGRGRALRDFLAFWRPGDRGEVFRWSDPAPGIAELLRWVQGR